MDIKDFEKKETINFEEFRNWLAGLIRAKGGAVPDLKDWKAIKSMMDKVVPEKEIITVTVTVTEYQSDPPPFVPPYWGNPNEPCRSPQPFPGYREQPYYVGDVIPNPYEITCSDKVTVALPDAVSNVNAVANSFAVLDNGGEDCKQHPYSAGPQFEVDLSYTYNANWEDACKIMFESNE